ncbi:MAG: hypothetical protein ATN31_09915 [Candidatus Epulonipiscioides saccharophilum]|nr:MAG: hypothetical protein ATN31_09915 [Epulopiscium sp. AS2M-Bin001]
MDNTNQPIKTRNRNKTKFFHIKNFIRKSLFAENIDDYLNGKTLVDNVNLLPNSDLLTNERHYYKDNPNSYSEHIYYHQESQNSI